MDLKSSREYNKSKNPISQLQIECAYFNILTKLNPEANFDSIYSTLSLMAKQSYEEQTSRRFKGNLTQEKPVLTKKMAKTIFNSIKQTTKDYSFSQEQLDIEL